MRASNQDREVVAGILQKAMSEGRITIAELESRLDSVYAAKTLAELEPITVDLPGHSVSIIKPTTAAVSAVPLTRPMAISPGAASGNLVGVMSGVERKGIWTAPGHLNCVAIMGGIELDFTGAQLSSMETVINVTAIMGGVEITVPEGITVVVEGIGIMGAFVDSVHQTYGPESPVLRLRGLALMGGVEIRGRKRAIGA